MAESEAQHDGAPVAHKGVSARALWIVVGLVVVLAGLAALWMILSTRVEPESSGVVLEGFGAEATSTIAYAGRFPPRGERPLAHPLAIDGDRDTLYLAESDAGRISEYSYGGVFLDSVMVPAAPDATTFYPIDLAVLEGGQLAVVDGASARVLLVDPDAAHVEPRTLSVEGERFVQPTAVAADETRIAVADAGPGTITVFDTDGELLNVIGEELDPPLSFVGGMRFVGDALWVSDSTANRVMRVDVDSGEVVGSVGERLALPRGIDLDGDGRLYVAESFGPTIGVYDTTGETRVDTVQATDKTRAPDECDLLSPEDVLWFEDTSRLYVVDSTSGCVKIFNVRAEAP